MRSRSGYRNDSNRLKSRKHDFVLVSALAIVSLTGCSSTSEVPLTDGGASTSGVLDSPGEIEPAPATLFLASGDKLRGEAPGLVVFVGPGSEHSANGIGGRFTSYVDNAIDKEVHFSLSVPNGKSPFGKDYATASEWGYYNRALIIFLDPDGQCTSEPGGTFRTDIDDEGVVTGIASFTCLREGSQTPESHSFVFHSPRVELLCWARVEDEMTQEFSNDVWGHGPAELCEEVVLDE